MPRAAADSSVFHAIADPTRRAILDQLRHGERTAGELLEAVTAPARRAGGPGSGRSARRPRHAAVSQSTFSEHLGVLRGAGLVTSRKSGRHRVYAFRFEPLAEVLDWVAVYETFWNSRFEGLAAYLARRRENPS